MNKLRQFIFSSLLSKHPLVIFQTYRLMKSQLIAIAFLLPFSAHAQQKELKVSVENETKQEKTAAPVLIRLSEVKGLKFDVSSATVKDGEKVIPSQLDDLDNDGKNDELCFISSPLSSGGSQTYTVSLSASPSSTTFEPRVYADMMLDDKKKKHPFITAIEAPGSTNIYNDLYHHGAAFESELTAYRIYFDHRQNIDIYGKKSRQLELAATNFYTTPEQQSAGYGNDVLWAGNSIGCGSLKMWDGQAPVNWTDVRSRSQRIVANGPVRTLVEVIDRGARVDSTSSPIDVRTLYSQYAGHRDVRVDITLSRPVTTPILCTGVQKIGSSAEAFTQNGGVKSEGFVKQNGLAASWGSDYPEMGKKEQFPPEPVGLAIRVPETYIASTTTDDLNYLIVLGKPGQQQLHYHVMFGAAKETEGCHNATEWFRYAESWDPSDVTIRY